jgi:hypothetical protein
VSITRKWSKKRKKMKTVWVAKSFSFPELECLPLLPLALLLLYPLTATISVTLVP